MATHRKIETATRLKKFHSTMSNAFRRAEVDNGNAINWDWGNNYGKNTPNGPDVFSKIFPLISPYLNYAKIEKTNLDLAYPTKDLDTVYFNDGTYFYVANALSNYTDKNTNLIHPCFALIYDVNGERKPNTPGRDIFPFWYCQPGIQKTYGRVVNPSSLPYIYFDPNKTRKYLIDDCKSNSYKSASTYWSCIYLIIKDGWEIKSDYPLKI